MTDGADLQQLTLRLLDYCKARDWSGYDPYDALNSRMFNALPLNRSKIARLILTQSLKRSPVDFRRLLGVSPGKNPKAVALFISSTIQLARIGVCDEAVITSLVNDLLALRSPETSYWCWGYSFPWQTRNRLVPRGA